MAPGPGSPRPEILDPERGGPYDWEVPQRRGNVMKIALTGATGFIGHYIARHLVGLRHTLRCWFRPASNRDGFESIAQAIDWVEGDLDNPASCHTLVAGCDAVVHAALYHPGGGFQGGEGNVTDFLQKNIVGTVELIEAARQAKANRFVFISTCAVHDKFLDDRPLDETHPLWPRSHYGAHKAAVEAFVHSYGLGHGYPICALRPTGVYGVARPAQESKWYDLISAVVRGEKVTCRRGGKEVHAADVAKAVGILLAAEGITGEAFNCYDRYVSDYDVALLAKQITGSRSQIQGGQTRPKHQIETSKIRALGMAFGGNRLLEETIREIVRAVNA